MVQKCISQHNGFSADQSDILLHYPSLSILVYLLCCEKSTVIKSN